MASGDFSDRDVEKMASCGNYVRMRWGRIGDGLGSEGWGWGLGRDWKRDWVGFQGLEELLVVSDKEEIKLATTIKKAYQLNILDHN